jgi:hypothetical protein
LCSEKKAYVLSDVTDNLDHAGIGSFCASACSRLG